MGSSLQFRAGSSQPNRSYLSSNTLLIQESSVFHEQCIPKETRDRVRSAPPRSRNVRDYQICNHVMEEMIWEERVKKERTLQKNWFVFNFFYDCVYSRILEYWSFSMICYDSKYFRKFRKPKLHSKFILCLSKEKNTYIMGKSISVLLTFRC